MPGDLADLLERLLNQWHEQAEEYAQLQIGQGQEVYRAAASTLRMCKAQLTSTLQLAKALGKGPATHGRENTHES